MKIDWRKHSLCWLQDDEDTTGRYISINQLDCIKQTGVTFGFLENGCIHKVNWFIATFAKLYLL